jgi:hypothetical protein
MLPFSQDEEYVQPPRENGSRPPTNENPGQNGYIPEQPQTAPEQGRQGEKEESQEITEESKKIYQRCKKIIEYEHSGNKMFTEQDAREKLSELNNSVMDASIMRLVEKRLEKEKAGFIRMMGKLPDKSVNGEDDSGGEKNGS